MSRNQQIDALPWLQTAAVERMERFFQVRPNARVFEWGAGGSTLWFSRHAYSVVSVEHDLAYHAMVSKLLPTDPLANVALVYLPASDLYARFIGKFELPFDLILIDGVKRNECIAQTVQHSMLANGGLLVVDNTERDTEYARGLDLLANWVRTDYMGEWMTSIFSKP